MDNKNFCDGHWKGDDERPDAGGRPKTIKPDPGQACSFCPEPATHCGPYDASKPLPVVAVIEKAPVVEEGPPKRPSRRP